MRADLSVDLDSPTRKMLDEILDILFDDHMIKEDVKKSPKGRMAKFYTSTAFFPHLKREDSLNLPGQPDSVKFRIIRGTVKTMEW